ncbi:MAG: M23 family metallopeptidase [Thermoleophilaceae bacterium]|nr:M23 family metallopeptidase [Thermoleophilaceae bacterium]
MRPRRAFPALAVVLATSAALGPPAVAAPGEGGGVVAAPPAQETGSGGATYGQPAPKRKRRRGARPTSSQLSPHRFPIAGSFDWGGADARFGARRKGHRHQGQDLAAAAGTPVVAPYRGVVTAVQYQARAAGHYVVLHGDDYDYVFMHLRSGSIAVREGERVSTGARIGEVGSTGASSGPHLHFEIWESRGYDGGRPLDPLPLLEAWSETSPASG